MSKWHRDPADVQLEIAHAIGEGRDILEALRAPERDMETRPLEERAYDRLEHDHEVLRGFADE